MARSHGSLAPTRDSSRLLGSPARDPESARGFPGRPDFRCAPHDPRGRRLGVRHHGIAMGSLRVWCVPCLSPIPRDAPRPMVTGFVWPIRRRGALQRDGDHCPGARLRPLVDLRQSSGGWRTGTILAPPVRRREDGWLLLAHSRGVSRGAGACLARLFASSGACFASGFSSEFAVAGIFLLQKMALSDPADRILRNAHIHHP